MLTFNTKMMRKSLRTCAITICKPCELHNQHIYTADMVKDYSMLFVKVSKQDESNLIKNKNKKNFQVNDKMKL